MYKLYDSLISGNGYKIRLLLALLGEEYERIEMDLDAGATRTSEFLAKNSNGRIPLLELEDGTHLAESNAIQFYLAEGTPLLPGDRLERARVLQWMFFEQYSHEPYIAVLRFWVHTGAAERMDEAVLQEKREKGHAALAVMESHLAERDFFVADAYSIADIALYAYTHVADEGGFDLAPYSALRAWIERVRAQPRHISITHPC